MSINIILKKMQTHYKPGQVVEYTLRHDIQPILMNSMIGKTITLEYSGEIFCLSCNQKTKKTFNQGYCFKCFTTLAQCDSCQVQPELCHFSKGTCRQPTWGKENCFIPHTLYVANTSGIKVGITRSYQKLNRWCDQGATQALAIIELGQRLHAGLLEQQLKSFFADRTQWQTMLKGSSPDLDLDEVAEQVLEKLDEKIEYEVLQEAPIKIHYPVLEYPQKVKALNLDKTPKIHGTLMGVKAQYLILDVGVLNIRKFGGYRVQLNPTS